MEVLRSIVHFFLKEVEICIERNIKMSRYYAKQLQNKMYWGNEFIKYGIVLCLMIYKSLALVH